MRQRAFRSPLRVMIACGVVAIGVACGTSEGHPSVTGDIIINIDGGPDVWSGISTDAGGPGFSRYCSGTLLTPQLTLRFAPDGSLLENTTMAPAGTAFVVTYDSISQRPWAGVVINPDGTALVIQHLFYNGLDIPDSGGGLAPGTDFTTDCPTSPGGSVTVEAVLVESGTVYASSDLTGPPCTLPPGFVLTNPRTSGTPNAVGADSFMAVCGFVDGYSSGLAYQALVLK